jgi:hypothetical protein
MTLRQFALFVLVLATTAVTLLGFLTTISLIVSGKIGLGVLVALLTLFVIWDNFNDL